MLLNYLKLAIRILIRNPFFTFINVLGLSVGFAVFFILWQYSTEELKSDQFAKDYKQIYRACTRVQWSDDKVKWEEKIVGASPFWLEGIIGKYEKILDKTRFMPQHLFSQEYIQGHGKDIFISYTNELEERISFLESKVIYADPNFFDFFSIPLSRGISGKVLSFPDGMVISENTSKKYFGNEDPLGKIVLINDTAAFQITGIFRDRPNNTHLNFDVVLSTLRIQNGLEKLHLKGRTRFHPFCYYKFPLETNIPALEHKINHLSKEELTFLVYANTPYSTAEVIFQKVQDIAFENLIFDNHKLKSRYFLNTLKAGALIILIMAWINTLNLTLSLNRKRMKELAIRKTIGANSSNVIFQFLTESTIINLLAFLLAITLVQLFKSPSEILLKFYILPWSEIEFSAFIIFSLALFSGVVVTGLHPALITLNNTPRSLFGAFRSKTSSASLSSVLITIQFTGAVILVVSIFAVQQQFTFILNKDVGLDRKQVLVVDLPVIPVNNFKNDLQLFTKQVNDLAGISGFTVSNSLAVDIPDARINIAMVKDAPTIAVDCNGGVDENFLSFYDIKLLAGRNFQPDLPSDRNAILISKGAISRLGIENPEEAIGIRIEEAVGFQMNDTPIEVIGVFEDYSLRPFFNQPNSTNYGGKPGIVLTYKNFLAPRLLPKKVSFRLLPENPRNTIESIKAFYTKFFPGQVFNWYFLDEQINNQYQTYAVARNQMLFFTMLAVVITSLGLLGMMHNKVMQKVKEIGVRKVLGAGVPHIFQVLLNSTAKQVILATGLGIPSAYFLNLRYLENFSERITLQWWHFVLPVVILILILLATIGSVLWKAARGNPVDALKYE